MSRSFGRYAVAASAIAIAVIAFKCGKAIQSAQDTARQMTTRGRFAQLRLALENYHYVYGSFPPLILKRGEDEPGYSWRVALLPFMELGEVYDRYDFSQPWNSDNNTKLANSIPNDASSFFRSPRVAPGDPNRTDFVGARARQLNWPTDRPCPALAVTVNGDSFILVELPDSDIHWMEPREQDSHANPPRKSLLP